MHEGSDAGEQKHTGIGRAHIDGAEASDWEVRRHKQAGCYSDSGREHSPAPIMAKQGSLNNIYDQYAQAANGRLAEATEQLSFKAP